MDYWADTGFAAGKVFSILEGLEDKSSGITQLKKSVNHKCFDYALGWLLREEKIVIEGEGRKVIVKL
ncbi:MAG: winged helix-turn-helix domain-containing protein, partial [Candidatus Altiarchaeota archaeon]|nr:winged helix-turn-helix domain-containing protein [Candidatus Altiarchaeota archaeon]